MTTHPLETTRRWVRDWVMAQDLCPFAAAEFERERIRYRQLDGADDAALLMAVIEECEYLDDHQDMETTLLVLTPGAEDFFTFLDKLDMAERLMISEGYEGVYQLASFHPDYLFGDSQASPGQEDPADYTNRSPFPLFHLLRETSLEAALARFPHPERIPERNQAHLRQQGIAWCRQIQDAISSETPSS
ncbi:DUF1415 domain-containing protein [uncultured Kushneria sp.]|uniref:DUF1415 domain-containing protein n=1 Tax=uncultured Kushneria sp. TaxID=905033 RepID=UPI00262C99A5|nr:DUF1415 domain-containing protein [uncultured Kushneria sp.]